MPSWPARWRAISACNEDLTEAIALAHDLGHTPFGHAGSGHAERLHGSRFGGFEHNLQSLRVVDRLERRYASVSDGLNLCLETREGILKHCSRRNAEQLEAARTRRRGSAAFCAMAGWPSPALEAQLCNLADELAYCAHDIDDGVRSGLLPLVEALDAATPGRRAGCRKFEREEGAELAPRVLLYTTLAPTAAAIAVGRPGCRQQAAPELRAAAPVDAEAVREPAGR